MVQLRPGQPHRLCGSTGLTNTVSLSRAFGNAWALELGLTWEPDALTLALPPPAAVPAPSTPASPRGGPLGTLGSSSGSTDAEDGAQTAPAPAAPARHVLVLASDGLWDVVTNEEAVAVAFRCEGGACSCGWPAEVRVKCSAPLHPGTAR